jgi:hypothetical protein
VRVFVAKSDLPSRVDRSHAVFSARAKGWWAMRGSILVAVVVLFGFEGSALAQTKEKTPEVMVFPDDQLLTTPLFPDSAKIGGAHRPLRVLLVRPRLHFVPELLKTIENL